MPQRHTILRNLYEMFYSVRSKLIELTASKWTDLEIYGWLNEGQQLIARKSLCLEKEVAITTVEGTREYDLKTTTNSFADIIDISESGVNYDVNGDTANNRDLIYKSISSLNREFQGWRGVSNSIPQYYYYKKASKTIGLYPEPDDSNDGLYLHVNGYYLPKILNAGTAKAGTTTTLTLADGSSTVPYSSTIADYYNNLYIEIYGGTGAGESAKITDYDGAGKCTVDFTTTPDATSVYGMVPEINEDACYLMVLYAMWKANMKGGSRSQLGNLYKEEFYSGLGLFMDEVNEDNEEIIKESYR